MKVTLVEDWTKAWKWASVRLAVLAGVAAELYAEVPAFQAYIPDQVFHRVMGALIVLIIIGRLIKIGGNGVQPPAQ